MWYVQTHSLLHVNPAALWGRESVSVLFVTGSSPGRGLSGPAHTGHHGVDDKRRPEELLALAAS